MGKANSVGGISLFLYFSFLASLSGQGPTLIKDINPTPVNHSSNPYFNHQLTNKGTIAFFSAFVFSTGMELYRTLGVTGTTRLVKDINPGNGKAGSEPRAFTTINGVTYFVADDRVHGFELWRSDGTGAGTCLVKDINPGAASADILLNRYNLVGPIGNFLYFSANDGKHGPELWKTDGTAAGTSMVVEVTPGPKYERLNSMTAIGNEVWFEVGGYLHKSDGTAKGAAAIKLTNPNMRIYTPNRMVKWGKRVVFLGNDPLYGDEILCTDGTGAGTGIFLDINPGQASSKVCSLYTLNGLLFFDDGVNVWQSDGTVGGTKMIFQPTVAAPKVLATSLLFSAKCGNSFFYFCAAWGNIAHMFVRGSYVVKMEVPTVGKPPIINTSFINGNGFGSIPYEYNGSYYLFCGGYLYRWSAKAPSFSVLAPVESRGPCSGVATVPSRGLLFSAYDKEAGQELWITDGTTKGTRLLEDINSPDLGTTKSGEFKKMADFNGKALFLAGDGATYQTLWCSDRTSGGTIRLLGEGYTVSDFIVHGDRAFFVAGMSLSPNELWRTDGTVGGTQRVASFWTIREPIVMLGGCVFITACNPFFSGSGLWKSDGTTAGTILLNKALAGAKHFCPVGKRLFFLCNDQLWLTDGTVAGTVMVKAFSAPSFFRSPVAYGGELYFFVDDKVHGLELWKSDGTTMGTVLVNDTNPGAKGTCFSRLKPIFEGLYFIARPPTANYQIFKLNQGSPGITPVFTFPAGTTPSNDIFSQKDCLFAAGGKLFFIMEKRDPLTMYWLEEIWALDPSAPGARCIQSLSPDLVWATQSGNSHFFYGHKGDLWKSDGSKAGTTKLTSAYPANRINRIVIVGGDLVYAADYGTKGMALWGVDPGASSHQFGSPVGSGPQSLLLGCGAPIIGKNMAITLQGVRPSTATLILLGQTGSPLNLGNGRFFYPLFNGPLITIPATTKLIPIPNQTALAGRSLTGQALMGPTSTTPFGLDFSNGVTITCGLK